MFAFCPPCMCLERKMECVGDEGGVSPLKSRLYLPKFLKYCCLIIYEMHSLGVWVNFKRYYFAEQICEMLLRWIQEIKSRAFVPIIKQNQADKHVLEVKEMLINLQVRIEYHDICVSGIKLVVLKDKTSDEICGAYLLILKGCSCQICVDKWPELWEGSLDGFFIAIPVLAYVLLVCCCGTNSLISLFSFPIFHCSFHL